MVARTSLIAASSIFSLSLAAPILHATSRAIAARGTYIMFGGDGTTATGWPSQKQWLDWDDAWKANLNTIKTSCQNNGWGPNNSDEEIQAIKDSIIGESQSSGIPKEYILAIVIQESSGCVRVPTTRWSHDNPGLMQSAQGPGTCNPSGTPISPCPSTTIRQMIHDGTNGDGLDTSLVQCVANSGATDDSKWYKAARLYNAGSITNNNLGIGPTPCYASDVANRLISPFDASTCDSSVIASLSSAQGSIPNANTNTTPDEPSTAASATTGNDAPTTDPAKPALIVDGAATGCTSYYTPQPGDTCASAPIDFATLCSLNTQLNSDCSNLQAGFAYCIAV